MNHHLNKIFQYQWKIKQSTQNTGYAISVPLTILKKKEQLNFMEVHQGKNSDPFFEVLQWNIRINSHKHRLLTTNKITTAIPLFVLGYLFLTLPLC